MDNGCSAAECPPGQLGLVTWRAVQGKTWSWPHRLLRTPGPRHCCLGSLPVQAAGVNPAGAQAGGGTGSAAHTAPTMPALAGGGGLAGDGGFGAAPGGVGELGGGGAQQAQQGPDLTSQLLSFLGPYGK